MKVLSLVQILIICTLPFYLHGQWSISGRILDQSAQALIGTTIQIKGTSIGTTSDMDGRFNLEIPEDSTLTLLFRFTGFTTQAIKVGDRRYFEILMQLSQEALDEVVVIGYGTQTRRRITSSVVSLDSQAFKGLIAPNFQVAMEGRLPGVVVNQSNGSLGAESMIRVRGPASINASNQSLIVVDGLILSDIGLGSNFGNVISPYFNLNPKDIASVEVLKDAAASSIYGSRGANGVILITTKRGRFNQPPEVNIGGQTGFSEVSNYYDMLNGQEYAELWNRAAKAINLPENHRFYYDVASQPSTDWFDLLTRRGFVQDYFANVKGGTAGGTRYYIGGSFRNEESHFKYSDSRRYTFRANIDQQLGEQWQVGLSVAPSRSETARTGDSNGYRSPTSSSYFFPNIDPYDENGQLRGGELIRTSIGMTRGGSTPLSDLKESGIDQTLSHLLFNTYISYSPFTALELRAEFAADQIHVDENFKGSSKTSFGFGIDGYGYAQTEAIANYNWTGLATFYQTINEHDIKTTLGINLTRSNYGGHWVDGGNFANDRLQYLEAAATIFSGESWKTASSFQGYFARAEYAFQNKYLLTLSGRYDGSSRFGVDNRFGFFPAISAGWVLTDEPFFQTSKINFLKLRSSFGFAGNAEIGDFASRGLISFNADYNGQPGFQASNLENRKLGWEQTQQWDVGLEFKLFDNRLYGTLGYYIKDTKDMLLNAPVPETSGYSSLTQNIGAMQNRGFEFDLSADILKGRFHWNISLNGATLHNEIKALVDNDGDGLDDDISLTGSALIYRTGENVSSFYSVRYAGVDPANGDALFYDKEGNTIVNNTPESARVLVGRALPDLTGGISSMMRFAGFDLLIHFKFATGHQKIRVEGIAIESNLASVFNQRKNQLNAWTPENPNTTIPEARLFTNNGSQPSTRYLDDADFLRLKSLQFGYTFQEIGKNKANLRLYLSGQNLLLFTKYTGLDPEVGVDVRSPATGAASLFTSPLPRQITFGFNLQL